MTVPRWRLAERPELGPINSLIRSLKSIEAENADAFPDFTSSRSLCLASDYSGQHQGSVFETYAFLLIDRNAMGPWLEARQAIRSVLLSDGRRMSYKNLGDRYRQAALLPFLLGANLLPGILAVVAVEKGLRTLFDASGPPEAWDPSLRPLEKMPKFAVERLLRLCHLGGLLVAGLSHPNQDLLWLSDEDDVVANAERTRLAVKTFGNVSGHYLPHTLGHLRLASTASDTGRRDVEDLVAIADLAAGSVCSVLNGYRKAGVQVGESLALPPEALPIKDRPLMDWFSDAGQPLKRVVLSFECTKTSKPFLFRRYRFHDSRHRA